MNVLIIGSGYPALQKTIDWLNATTWMISRLSVVEERASKMAYVFEKINEQPHHFLLENISITPKGMQNKESTFRVGRAMSINSYIKHHFPDGGIDYLFFCVNNDKAEQILDEIDPSVHKIRDYYFLQPRGEDHE
jgi:hypothetical protein